MFEVTIFFTVKISCSFETPETTRAQELHNSDDLIPSQHQCENLESRMMYIAGGRFKTILTFYIPKFEILMSTFHSLVG